MNLLYQSAFLKALGWSLLNSLWQMALLWLVYMGLTLNGKKLLSRQRHAIALLSLAGGSLWFLTTLVINLYKAANGPQLITLYVPENDPDLTTASWPGFIAHWFEPALPFLSLAYLVAAAFLFIRFYFQYRHTQQLFTKGLQKAHPEWRIFLQQAVQHMGIKKKVQIWLSSLVDTPVTLGVFKPIILLPVAAVNHLSLNQAEAIILHELNHIRRNDYLVNLLIACVDVILFFNPFARLLTGIIRKERENCCDDLVLQFRYDAHSYARALLSLEQNRIDTSALTLAATGKDKYFLLNRVKRILGKETSSNPFNQKLVAYLLCTLLIAFIGWYNPGNLIIKKLDAVRSSAPVAAIETAQTFTTPPSGNDLIKHPVYEAAPGEPVQSKKRDTCLEQKDPYKKLEQIIELTTDAKLAAISKQLDESSEEMVGFAKNTNEVTVDYSLPESTPAPQPPLPQEVYPYVPDNSFYVQAIEDTSQPKKYVMTFTDIKAKEAMAKSMLALQQVDWKKLEASLKAQGMKINMEQIQRELAKAMQQVDWKKLNETTDLAMDEAQDQLKKMQEAYVIQLSNFQKDRSLRLERLKQAQQQILLDRLQQREQIKRMEADRKLLEKEQARKRTDEATVRRKKIIHI